ncbi:hypothetical protein [Flagellimonas chongwuensis]|nr:hypothetical protein [Allomuricauda chongwuensis]
MEATTITKKGLREFKMELLEDINYISHLNGSLDSLPRTVA